MKRNTKEGMGKGIRALLGSIDDNSTVKKPVAEVVNNVVKQQQDAINQNATFEIALEEIEVNPFQPRKEFEANALKELMDSIEIHGIIQPITVRKVGANKYQLISGERRFRASKELALTKIPAFVRKANDQQMLEMALIENVQRADLNAIEIGLSYQRLINECNLTHDELSKQIGKSRTVVTNYLRLLKLPPEVQKGLKSKDLSMGHARTIAGIKDVVLQIAVSKEVIENKLSVRETETLAKKYTEGERKVSPQKKLVDKSLSLPLAYKKIQDKIMESLETKVVLKRKNNGSGELVIKFYNDSDLERLIDVFEK